MEVRLRLLLLLVAVVPILGQWQGKNILHGVTHAYGNKIANYVFVICRMAKKKRNGILPAICGWNIWYPCMR